MKIINRIRAFFNIKGESKEMEVISAEIKQGRVFLRPAAESNKVFSINTKNVDIFINPLAEVAEDDIEVMDTSEPRKEIKENKPILGEVPEKEPSDLKPHIATSPDDISNLPEDPDAYIIPNHPGVVTRRRYAPKKKVLRFTLYVDEYDEIMNTIRTNGYRKSEYLLACVNATKKSSWDSLYKKYAIDHRNRRAEERIVAKQEKSLGENTSISN